MCTYLGQFLSHNYFASRLISDFISIMQTLLGSSDLQRVVKSQLKRSKLFCISRLLNLTESLRVCTITFITQLGKNRHIPL